MYSLQTTISVNQASFGITDKGDFRMVLDCFRALNDDELSDTEKMYACLIIFYEDINDIEDLDKYADYIEELQTEMMKFFNGGEDEPQGAKSNYRLIDWDKDSNLICSAINNVANTEIRTLEYLHWWTFLGYYLAVGECALSTVVNIRQKIAKDIKLEDYEKKFRKENPEYFNIDLRSAEQKEADDYIRRLWGVIVNGRYRY